MCLKGLLLNIDLLVEQQELLSQTEKKKHSLNPPDQLKTKIFQDS